MIGGFTVEPSFALQFHKMGSFRRPRPRFMSSPVLSDLPRFQAARQALQLSSSSAWNSVQTAVLNVFKGRGLQKNELYTLNENIRWLLKSELGSFITDYFQNQLLAKGLLFTEEKVKLCEDEDRIDVLSKIWDHYFTETLPTLQAIFYPVQSVHEPTGPSEGYLQLEELVKQVVSPYLGLCEDHSFSGSTCLLERQYSRSHPKTSVLNYSSHVVMTRQASEVALTPLTEQEGEAYLEKCGSIRRHTVANAHSDIQLLAMASMMHTGMVVEESESTDKCLLLQPSFSHRQCSSEPSIADEPDIVIPAGRQDPADLNCTPAS
ncbi:proline-rich protein 5-like isoform X3 [Apus apus]|uniref:proline-rich protein 5-like isoform X3 n=1 Tax=Apus apus TaxID=8895 RepID=UPI0021F8F516|nr:proline-rich protein 5-like isoform X3 [Apus apus]